MAKGMPLSKDLRGQASHKPGEKIRCMESAARAKAPRCLQGVGRRQAGGSGATGDSGLYSRRERSPRRLWCGSQDH